jgi:hypothetical protein
MERRVSEYLRNLPFLWVGIGDEPGPGSDRAYIARNAIALTGNFEKPTIDPRADTWLGQHSPIEKIRASGLWNINHVAESYDPVFLDTLKGYIDRMPRLD